MAAETSSAAADYVEREINPTLIRALQALCHARPSNPVEWLANWLLRYQQDHRRATLVDSQERAEFKDFISTRMARFHLTPTEELIDRVAFGYAASGGLTLADAEKLWCGDNHPFPMFDSAVLQPQPVDKPGAAVLYTGMFSPVHHGHLAVAETAKRALALRGYHNVRVFFSPHATFREEIKFRKKGERPAGVEHRVRMLELAGCETDAFEGTDAYYSDSFHGLRAAFAARLPEGWQSFILYGADKGNWRRVRKEVAVGIGTLVVVAPPRDDPNAPHILELQEKAADAATSHHGPVVVHVAEPFEQAFSSTAVRKLLKSPLDHQTLVSMVPEPVAQYIQDNGLYTGSVDRTSV